MNTEAVMADRQRTKGELLDEYAWLESRLDRRSYFLHLEEKTLTHREAALDRARDTVAWLPGSTGTPADLRRLEAATLALSTRKLGEAVLAYSRKAIRERWRRPSREEWHRLANLARRELRVRIRTETESLEQAWAEHRLNEQRYEKMRARRAELRWLLGEDAEKVEIFYSD